MISELIAKYRARGRQRLPVRVPLSEEVNRVITWLMVTLLFLLVGSGALFLYGMSSSAQNGYALLQTRLQNDRLETENRDLKLKVLKAQSFKNLERTETFRDMAKP